jgi:hypothetical protein
MGGLFAGARGGVVGRSVFAMVGAGLECGSWRFPEQTCPAMVRREYTSTASTLLVQDMECRRLGVSICEWRADLRRK